LGVDSLSLGQYRLPPFEHQIRGVERLLEEPAFGLFDEMGLGKSKQAIDAACELFIRGVIDLVLVLTPAAAVRGVWLDQDYGEVVKHAWAPWVAYVYHHKGLVKVGQSQPQPPRLGFLVTNYEYIRRRVKVKRKWTYPRVKDLEKLTKGRKILLVVDESSAVAYPKSAQTRAVYALRQFCHRVILLNGTPVSNNPLNIYSQFKIMDPRIFARATEESDGCKSFTEFKTKYAILGRFGQPVRYQNMEDFQARTTPYCIRRLKEDCLDLAPKLYTQREVALSTETWRIYREMRDEMVAWLDTGEASVARQAVVKVVRLAQITSGLLGGFEDDPEAKVIGTEKVSFVHDLLNSLIEDEKRLIVWSRFRKEQRLLFEKLAQHGHTTYRIYGGKPQAERDLAIGQISDHRNTQTAILLGQPKAGGIALNLTTAATAIYISTDYSLLTRKQSEDRIHRMGQVRPVTIVDILATGPNGQKTIDHGILRALKEKEDIATWTTSKWREVLLAA
jgi:SNF2 family DNA or RNA helicase